jgi:hypothetical protein
VDTLAEGTRIDIKASDYKTTFESQKIKFLGITSSCDGTWKGDISPANLKFGIPESGGVACVRNGKVNGPVYSYFGNNIQLDGIFKDGNIFSIDSKKNNNTKVAKVDFVAKYKGFDLYNLENADCVSDNFEKLNFKQEGDALKFKSDKNTEYKTLEKPESDSENEQNDKDKGMFGFGPKVRSSLFISVNEDAFEKKADQQAKVKGYLTNSFLNWKKIPSTSDCGKAQGGEWMESGGIDKGGNFKGYLCFKNGIPIGTGKYIRYDSAGHEVLTAIAKFEDGIIIEESEYRPGFQGPTFQRKLISKDWNGYLVYDYSKNICADNKYKHVKEWIKKNNGYILRHTKIDALGKSTVVAELPFEDIVAARKSGQNHGEDGHLQRGVK